MLQGADAKLMLAELFILCEEQLAKFLFVCGLRVVYQSLLV